MLRKIIIVGALFSFTLSIPCAVLAKESTSGATRQEKIEARKEKPATREATLRKKLDAFRNREKAEVVDRVNTNLNGINRKQTRQMTKHLDKMSALLDKLAVRVNSGSPDVKDPAAAGAAIADAKTALDAASAAVKAQAEKDYTLQITSESRVKADAQKVRENLHTDLKALRQLVIDAKQAVANAIRVSKGLRKEATSSGQ